MTQGVRVRRMTENDLPLVAAWLREPHVQRWWRDPSAPDNVTEKYLPRIRGTSPTEMFVIELEDEPIGMIQRYRMADHPDWWRTVAATGLTFGVCAGIDYVIGVPDLIGRGIGTALIRQFSDDVFRDYTEIDRIVVTPQHENRASCRVLEKAGYELQWTGMLDSDDPGDAGVAALYLLHRHD